MSSYSLRTGILTYLAFLLLAAMLLTNVIMLKFEERDLIGARVEQGWLAMDTLRRMVEKEKLSRKTGVKEISSDPQFLRQMDQVLHLAGFSELMWVDEAGSAVLQGGTWGDGRNEAITLARSSLASRKPLLEFSGSTWGVIWLSSENVKISSPLLLGSYPYGAMTLSAHLGPIYEKLRRSEKVVLLYILVSTALFLLFGIYLLSRTVIRPVHRLLRITERFTEGEPFPLPEESSGGEIGQLSRSLKMMLKRLEENKADLRAHISSLEKANADLKSAQDEIVRSEKLASVGRLSTGIAHEIGNPIGIILGYLELMKGTDLGAEQRDDFLDRIESEIMRINGIIRQLLDFSRPTGKRKRTMNVHTLIGEMVELMRPQPMMAGIEISPALQAKSDCVFGDPEGLKQVFLNIMINAADAMGEKGEPQGILKIMTFNVDHSIEVQFSDTGPGIPEEELVRIFDPFYTTKDPGKGTGLGLSVSYRIIEEMGGSLRAEGNPGAGATITVHMPLHGPDV